MVSILNIKSLKGVFAICAVVACFSAEATILHPYSYDEPNGYGQASGGTYNYWDGTFSGTGDTTLDGAPLKNGLGQLTNGEITKKPWYEVSNDAGTGKYVGWIGIDPTITFHFDDLSKLSRIYMNFDNSGVGGVFLPAEVIINGTDFTPTYPAMGGPVEEDFGGLNIKSETVKITIVPQAGDWVFLNQVQFFGSPKVATPAPAAVLTFGLAFAGQSRRRRRNA